MSEPVDEPLRERIERLVSELAERGELRAREIREATRELVGRSQRNRQELVRLIRKEIDRQRRSLSDAERADVERELRDLEQP